MSPRARRSESITLPPGNHPGLIRYNDDKTFSPSSEKHQDNDNVDEHDSDLDAASDTSNDCNDFYDSSNSSSVVLEPHGR